MTVQAAASPGRIALIGEHCDWAGGTSLVAPMGLQVHGRYFPDPDSAQIEIRSHHLPTGLSFEATYPLPTAPSRLRDRGDPLRYVAAVWAALRETGLSVPGGTLTLRSTLPMGRGFSSSAALCVATARVFSRAAGATLDFRQLADVATRAERDFVGVACGALDPLACAAGRPLVIQWPDLRGEARCLEIPRPFHLVASAFEQPRDTAKILSTLQARQRGDGPPIECEAVRTAIERWAQLAQVGAEALESGDVPSLGDAMVRAQAIYEDNLHTHIKALFAPRLQQICSALMDAGALGAKFSGAGGEGSVIALASSAGQAEALGEVFAGQNLPCWSVLLQPTNTA